MFLQSNFIYIDFVLFSMANVIWRGGIVPPPYRLGSFMYPWSAYIPSCRP